MFSTVLKEISGYFGKSFLVSVFFPGLFFWMLNLALGVLAVGLEQSLAWWESLNGQVQAFLTAAFLIWALFTAYVLHIFMDVLTRFYEGQWRWLKFIPAAMRRRSQNEWKALRASDETLGGQLRALQARQEALEKILNRETPALAYGERVDASAVAQDAGAFHDQIRDWTVADYLDDAKWQELEERLSALQARVLALSEDELAQHRAQIGPGSKADLVFRLPSESLQSLVGQLEQERLTVYQEWTMAFPARLSWVQPTRLGNHLYAAETYSFLRYKLDATVIWPRLREALPEKFANRLSDAKTNLDLMLVLTSLALVFGIVWGGIFLLVPERHLEVYKWIAAPIAVLLSLGMARVAYLNAAQSALAYGELLKAAFDLYRWEALKALHLDLPADLEGEKARWGQVCGLFYRNYPLDVPWKHPETPAKQ